MPDPRFQESMIDQSSNEPLNTTAERSKPCFQFGAVAPRNLLRSATGAGLYCSC